MKGIYILVIKLDKNLNINVGKLGKIKFNKGLYAYIGSAQNSLEKRISRHLSKNKRIRWHIDFLLENKNFKIEKIFYKKSPKSGNAKLQKNC